MSQDKCQQPGGLGIHPGEPGESGLDESDALANRGQARRTILFVVAQRVDDDPGFG